MIPYQRETPSAIGALIAEYNAIRATSLSRDQNLNTLRNMELVLLVGVFAYLPAVLAARHFFLLPLISMGFCALAAHVRKQSKSVWNLALYEHRVLRARLVKLLTQENSRIIPDVIEGLWDWQTFYVDMVLKPSKVVRLIEAEFVDWLNGVVTVTSIGLLVVFWLQRNQVHAYEWVLFSAAAALVAWSVLNWTMWSIKRSKLLRRRSVLARDGLVDL